MASAASIAVILMLSLTSNIGLIAAGSRYIAIPIDGLDVIELSPISSSVSSSPSSNHQPSIQSSNANANSRLPRQSQESSYVPLAVSALHHAESSNRPDHRRNSATAHVFDYVDFGAHTGPNGAFSWYADYPSHR